MLETAEPRPGRRLTWAAWAAAWILAPVAVWALDIAQGLMAQMPARGLCGTPETVVSGVLSSAGVYATVFLGVRSLLELPRCVLSLIRDSPVRVPSLLVALLSLLVIAWLDL